MNLSKGNVVELRLPAHGPHLYLARVVAGAVALHAGLDLDAVEDVRLAVDEIAARLVASATGPAHLECAFRTGPDGVEVVISCDRTARGLPDERGFSWHVVSVLTDSLQAAQAANRRNGDGPGWTTEVRFTKRNAA